LPDRVEEGLTLILENGKIKELSENIEYVVTDKIVDAKNNFVSPGFFDTHIHGASLYGFETDRQEEFYGICETLLDNGITTVLPTLICNETYISNLVRNINSVPEFRQRIAGIYLEGPFVNYSKKGGINPEYIRKPDVDYLKKIIDLSGGLLKMMTIAPELDGIDDIIEHLLNNDIIPCFGHSNAGLSEVLNKKGVRNITHLFNAMSGISHREPGLAVLPFINRDIFVEVNGDGVHLDNNIIKMVYENVNRDNLIFITDAVVSAGKPYGEYVYDNKKVISSERGVRYKENDVLMGSNNLIPDVLRNVTDVTDGNFADVIKTVTLNPAKLLGVDDVKGTIAPGKTADIVIFDEDFRVQEVIVS